MNERIHEQMNGLMETSKNNKDYVCMRWMNERLNG